MTVTQHSSHGEYVFDTRWEAERQRLATIETIWDHHTKNSIESLGLAQGWRCLEVGAGNGSIAAWLCDRGATVVATDTDTRFLELISAPSLEVREHNITRDQLEEDSYDLVHARLLLEHLPDHGKALDRMISALKPGGWLLLEEFDHVSFLPDPESPSGAQATWHAFLRAFAKLSEQRGLDLAYGRRLFTLLSARGLRDVACEGRTVVERGGDPSRALLRLSVLSLRDALAATGEMTGADVDAMAALLDDPSFSWTSQIMVTARARKP